MLEGFAGLPPLVFVTGAQRSGTTLLQTLICNSLPDAPVLPEAHLLADTLRAWKRARDNWAKSSYFFPTAEALAATIRGTAGAQLAALAALNPAAKYLVLKDPALLGVRAELRELFPAAPVIISVRDPRDIVASFIRIGRRARASGAKSVHRRRAAGPLAIGVRNGYDGVPADGDVVVKYEDLVADPNAALRHIANAAQLPLAPAIDALTWLDEAARHQPEWVSGLEGDGPRTDSVGAHRTVLSLRERAAVELRCGTLMKRFGYARSGGATALAIRLGRLIRR